MTITPTEVTDALTLVALLGFPGYLFYWVPYHLKRSRWRRLWVVLPAFAAWCAATWYCFIALALGCLGGGCAYRNYLGYAIVYVLVAAALVAFLHWSRAPRTTSSSLSSPAPPG